MSRELVAHFQVVALSTIKVILSTSCTKGEPSKETPGIVLQLHRDVCCCLWLLSKVEVDLDRCQERRLRVNPFCDAKLSDGKQSFLVTGCCLGPV